MATHKRDIDYSAGGELRHKSPDEAWEIIESLALYEEEEGWCDYYDKEEALNPENPNLEQLLEVMEEEVEKLMVNALSHMGESQEAFLLAEKKALAMLPTPTKQEEFDHITTRFDLDQNERVKRIESQIRDFLVTT